jgi:Arc/MetJ-type ribon-helix-helix transcriptional regulator
MNVRLKPHTEEWLKEQVAKGRFASLEDAVEILVREDQAAHADLEEADLAWAQPYIAKGLADVEAGRTVPADEVHAELRARFIRPRGA